MKITVVLWKIIEKTLKKTNLYGMTFKNMYSEIHPERIHKLALKEYDIKKIGLNEKQKEFYEKILKNEFFIFDRFRNIDEFKSIQQKEKPFWKCNWKDFDPKDYWEISRGFQWLPAYNYAKTIGEEQKVLNELEEWIRKTPYLKGLDWAVPLDVAIRTINLLILYQLSKADFLKVELWKYYTYLKKNLWISKKSIRNNHYLGELTAVTLLSDFFSQKQAKRYIKRLEKEFNRQFYEDGVNEEQSIRYHKFALEFMIIAKLFLNINTPRLEKAINFLRYTEKPNGTWPSIGDDDLGCVIKNTQQIFDYEYCLKFIYKEYSLLNRTKDFQEGGYLIHCNNDTKSQIIIKYGPHKWHAHADLFHLELTIYGVPILIDSGTYRYNNVSEKRRYFRSTKAHNTLEYNEKDQTEQWTTFRWKKGAKVIEKNIIQENKGIKFSAKHTGYKKYGIIHERIVEFNKELTEIKVIDKLTGNKTKNAKVFWHLNPKIIPEHTGIDEAGVYTLRTERRTLGTMKIIGGKTKTTKTLYSDYYSKLSEKEVIVSEIAPEENIVTTIFIFNN